MQNVIKTRKEIFEEMLKDGENAINWEMLCCSNKPLVPFIGAGVSSWCYPMWKQLLIGIVRKAYSDECVEYVNDAWECKEKPNVKHKDEFFWTEEIAECIFDEDKNTYEKNVEYHSLYNSEDEKLEDNILRRLRYYVGEESHSKKHEAVRLLYQEFSDELLKERGKVPEYQNYFPILFPDILVTTNYDNALKCVYPSILSYSYTDLEKRASEIDADKDIKEEVSEIETNTKEETIETNENIDEKKEVSQVAENIEIKENLKSNENTNTKVETSESETEIGTRSEVSENKADRDVNKDKIENNKPENRSWLYYAVQEKLKYRKKKLSGKRSVEPKVTIPDMPMLLKVHGSIERASELALTKTGYEKAYNTEIYELMKEICRQSTLIFIGYGLSRDRIMDLLKEYKEKDENMKHFAFLPKWQKENMKDLKKEYGVYPIYYDEEQEGLKALFQDKRERSEIFHNYFLGLLLENLARRKNKYPQPLELLWEKDRYKEDIKDKTENFYIHDNEQFVRREEALQIWKVLELSEECPLVAVVGRPGSGKSTLCQSLPKLQKGYSNPMQFFYISLANCKSWDEFCIRIYQELNIVELEITERENWREFANRVNSQCAVYWRSILILDYLDDISSCNKNQEIWDTIKKVLKYWKELKTRVVFSCQEYPEGLPCYIWRLEKLGKDEATKVFFNACTTRNVKNSTYLERKVVRELFARKELWPSSINLLGRYASSKSDLTSLLDEWDFYYKTGDKGEQTVARILWNHMLDGHKYEDIGNSEREDVRKNILWVWGILGTYPGVFPSEFFETFYKYGEECPGNIDNYKRKNLTETTLMIMKNIGLCMERENEKQKILLENIVECVKENFIKKVNGVGYKYIEDGKDISGTINLEEFDAEIENIGKDENRLRCFRGYLMKDWEWSLREYILIETREKDMTDDASKLDILDILKILGERVKNSEGRFENNELNLVLHYEIKTVLSFLWMCYPEIDNDNIVEVGYLFSHYYHYVPNYAYSVVKVFLQIMKNKEDKFLYKIAEMSRVMGDIQRLMGRKEKATDYYNQAVEFCHKQISRYLELCCGSKELNDDEKNIYEESLRIKAGVLLIRNYTFSYDETDETEFDEAIELYKKLDDEDGKAYYNQRMGELYYSKAEISNDNRIEMYNQIKKFYDASYKLNKKLKNKTGVAYIQKCQGDLKVKFKDSINEKWFGEAVKNYYDAFMTYYGNINWRGFANVMQAMNTCLRLHRKNEEGENPNITLYNLAEECYRWLGDVRGLADTLDYEGHELRGIKNEDDTSKGKGDESERAKEELHQYMALGKWLESRELWSKQENKQKVTYADNNITELKLLGGKSWGIWT